MRHVTIALIICAFCRNSPVVAQKSNFKLDHFKFYKIDAEGTTDTSIMIKGQFDNAYETVRIVGPALFANPVVKNGGPILDAKAHFTTYFIRAGGAEPPRVVSFQNQFGNQRAEIGRAELFLAPSGKIYKNNHISKSESLDHFKCYRVENGAAVNRKVTLTDQFKEREENVAVRPVFFCVPVEKQHNGRTTKITNERDHLVIYELEVHTSRPTFDIGTIDQFDDLRGEVYTVMWLGLPTLKRDFKVKEQG